MSLVELELELETPLFAGGHEPQKLDELWILRPSEVKGVWRWWARALVAGALYDAGQLKGEGKHGILKAPKPEEAREIAKIVGEEMGLGYADPQGKSSKASSYSLMVKLADTHMKESKKDYKRAYEGGPLTIGEIKVNLQRLKLLALSSRREKETALSSRPKWKIEYLAPGTRFRLRIEEQLPTRHEAVEAALLALSLALTLGGFGKGGRRGLGCFRIIKAKGPYATLFDKRMSVAERVMRAMNAVRKITRTEAVESERRELPPLPSVSARKLTAGYTIGNSELRPFHVIEVRGDDTIRFLENLHNFFLRGERAKRLLGNPKLPDVLRQNFNAWVLGLPREQQEPKKRQETGYKIEVEDVDRRASPLWLAVHDGIAYLSVFVSADWPQKLTWRGIKKERNKEEKEIERTQPIPLDESRIAGAIVTAVEEFANYAEKCGFRVNFIWP